MIISGKHTVFAMDKENKPVEKISSGDVLVFETLDCFSNTLKSEEDTIDQVDFNRVNPATGPVFVEGAMPGDTLKVTIHEINIDDQAVSVAAQGLGRLGDLIEENETGIVQIHGDVGEYKGFEFPLNKMVGVIGTAPAGEPIVTGTPGDHGGNLDCTQVAEGNSIYLPVEVEGGLLAMGDLHAAMGDGEIGGAAAETRGKVTVSVEVLKDYPYPLPMIETPTHWITLASRESIEEATDLAIKNMSQVVMDKNNMTLNEAYMYMTFVSDVITCQIVNPAVTMRVETPKSALK